MALVLGFSWYALVRAHSGDAGSDVTELLIGEILTDEPQLLTFHEERPALTDRSQAHDPPVD